MTKIKAVRGEETSHDDQSTLNTELCVTFMGYTVTQYTVP